MTAQNKNAASDASAFEELMNGFYQAAGVKSMRKAGDKHRFRVGDAMVIAAFVRHAYGPGIFLAAHFELDINKGHSELLAAAMCNNFLMHALGAPATWGINPMLDRLAAMSCLPLASLTPDMLAAHVEQFVAAAGQQLKEMTSSGMLAPSRVEGRQGGGMRSNLFAMAKTSAAKRDE